MNYETEIKELEDEYNTLLSQPSYSEEEYFAKERRICGIMIMVRVLAYFSKK